MEVISIKFLLSRFKYNYRWDPIKLQRLKRKQEKKARWSNFYKTVAVTNEVLTPPIEDPIKLQRLKRKQEKKARWSNFYKTVAVTNEVLTPPIEEEEKLLKKVEPAIKAPDPGANDDKVTLSWCKSESVAMDEDSQPEEKVSASDLYEPESPNDDTNDGDEGSQEEKCEVKEKKEEQQKMEHDGDEDSESRDRKDSEEDRDRDRDRELTEEEEWALLNERLVIKEQERLEREKRQAEEDARKFEEMSKDPIKLQRLKRKQEKKARWSNFYKTVAVTNEVLTPPIEEEEKLLKKVEPAIKAPDPGANDDKVTLSWYDSDLNQFLELPDLKSVVPMTEGALAHAWAGSRATHGVTTGRVCFEVRVGTVVTTTEATDKEVISNGLRVGWSTEDSSLHLGDGELSWGYESTGRAVNNGEFKDYGKLYAEKDVIGAYLDMESNPCTISYTLNGEELGNAYEFDKALLGDKPIYPHILTKNICYKVNFGYERYNLLTRTKVVRQRIEVPIEQVIEEKKARQAEIERLKEEANRRNKERKERERKEREERQKKRELEREKSSRERKEKVAEERRERGEESEERKERGDEPEERRERGEESEEKRDKGEESEEKRERGEKSEETREREVEPEEKEKETQQEPDAEGRPEKADVEEPAKQAKENGDSELKNEPMETDQSEPKETQAKEQEKEASDKEEEKQEVKDEPSAEVEKEVTEDDLLKGLLLDQRMKNVIRYFAEEELDGEEASLLAGYVLLAHAQTTPGPRPPPTTAECESAWPLQRRPDVQNMALTCARRSGGRGYHADVMSASPTIGGDVILMVGMPGSGKTYWVKNHVTEYPERRYNVLSTGALFEKMRVDCKPFRSSYEGRWDAMVTKCAKCVLKLLEMARGRKRNYILDQTNVYPSAQRRKLREFDGYRRVAVVIVTDEETYKERHKRREEADGKEVPDGAIVDMKANFTLPEKGAWLDEVIYPELEEEEARKILEGFHKEARAAGVVREREKRERSASRDGHPPHKRARDERRHSRDDRRPRDFPRDREDRWGGGGGGGGGGGRGGGQGRWGPAARGGGQSRWGPGNGRDRGGHAPPGRFDRQWGGPQHNRNNEFGRNDRDNFRGGRGGPGMRGDRGRGPPPGDASRFSRDRTNNRGPQQDKRPGPGNMGAGMGSWQRGGAPPQGAGRGRGGQGPAGAQGGLARSQGKDGANQNQNQGMNPQNQANWNQWANNWGGWGNWNQNQGNEEMYRKKYLPFLCVTSPIKSVSRNGWEGDKDLNEASGTHLTWSFSFEACLLCGHGIVLDESGPGGAGKGQQAGAGAGAGGQGQWSGYTAQQWYQWQQWQQQHGWPGYQQPQGAQQTGNMDAQAWAQYYQNYSGAGNNNGSTAAVTGVPPPAADKK
ncbi:Heterogeneous nuclear ribonucleoprotein U-like protein 1 [Papilio xuthus]|uniref:Heterogeneous nuclear ribonucleoprotein U-like protein 1 n=1 Tax=Papilio xuthus TaxID=66420 RepID=A0A194QN05_PAPXU|nr:Heterogeneous nuclear ribonucleoprotein U-like protein 1 [Papilio xuthus]